MDEVDLAMPSLFSKWFFRMYACGVLMDDDLVDYDILKT
jgi:hypothetical protein